MRRKAFLMAGLFTVAAHSALGQPLDEITLGLNRRAEILRQSPALDGASANQLAQSVFQSLLATTVPLAGPALPYRLTLIQNDTANAFSTAAGQIYVHSGLTPVLSNEPGLWTAVLAHEIGHAAAQHHYRAYLRKFELQKLRADLQWRASLGDTAAQWALLAAKFGGDILDLKLSRNEELEADRLGMQMMAEAGYHPDHAVTMFRRMGAHTGDSSKLAAFFADHPRWETREQRATKAYEAALAIFRAGWPDEARSPGGLPPVIATIGAPKVTEHKHPRALTIQAPIRIRHARGKAVDVTAVFSQRGAPVPAATLAFSNGEGALQAPQRFTPGEDDVTVDFTAILPAAALQQKNRTLDAILEAKAGPEPLDQSPPFRVAIPKPK